MDVSRGNVPRPDPELESVLNAAPPRARALLNTDTSHLPDPVAIPISIVSNSRLLSEGLLALLAPNLNLRLIGTYAGEIYAQSPLPNPRGHVILLDSGVGRVAALAWIRLWHGLTPPGYILILELTNNVDLLLACIEAGAGGYLLQGTSGEGVVEAIKEAYAGVGRLSPEVTAQLFAGQAPYKIPINQSWPSVLTAREVEVLCCISKGYSNAEIAVELVIEVRTVKQHIHHILGKLHLRSRWEVARVAAERGWLDSI